ncbi:MAG: acetyl-CoA C-acyltransferase [Betaproteobacteria bacterium]
MPDAFICDAIRTPLGPYAGALASVRPDDLAALPLKALATRNARVDWAAVDDVLLGCANQAGEDNRNVARMAWLLAGLPDSVGAATVNRLCGSGLDAVAIAARAIRAGEAELMVAGGVESMSRAPFVMPKADAAFSRANAVCDTTIGWRFVNPAFKARYGIDAMPETAENVASEFGISRADQDKMAPASQGKALAAQASVFFDAEIVPFTLPTRKGEPVVVARDEHPRETTLEAPGKRKPIVKPDGSVTADNASGVNDGACAADHRLGSRRACAGVDAAGAHRRQSGRRRGTTDHGHRPGAATQKLLARCGVTLAELDVIELNEAFAAQGLAVLRLLGLPDDDPRVNPNGGAIALGHPLGMSGARLVTTAVSQLHRSGGRYALATMCIGVGQGNAMLRERVEPEASPSFPRKREPSGVGESRWVPACAGTTRKALSLRLQPPLRPPAFPADRPAP